MFIGIKRAHNQLTKHVHVSDELAYVRLFVRCNSSVKATHQSSRMLQSFMAGCLVAPAADTSGRPVGAGDRHGERASRQDGRWSRLLLQLQLAMYGALS